MIERFFGEEARTRIAAAVREAESRSTGQIVPVVVDKSAGYPEARYRGGFLGAALVTLVVLGFRLPLTLAELPILQLAAGIVGALVALWDPVERVLAGRTELALAVHDRAVRAFRENGLDATADGTGVLVFASLFERRAVVMGDHGIHARMPDGEWQRAVDALIEGMQRDDPATGFCEAVALCGARLAEHFPRAGAVTHGNELSDGLRTSQR